MSDAILVAIITGVLTFAGVLVSAFATRSKTAAEIKTAQAITDTKIDELTREVRKHNNFAERVPVIEEKIAVANHRIEDLEKKAG